MASCMRDHIIRYFPLAERTRSSQVLIFDRVGEVKASGLRGCQLLVGPCQGSVYLDDCKDCTVIARADNPRGPGGPTGPLGTPSRTPWAHSG
jgi:hypothetical protein